MFLFSIVLPKPVKYPNNNRIYLLQPRFREATTKRRVWLFQETTKPMVVSVSRPLYCTFDEPALTYWLEYLCYYLLHWCVHKYTWSHQWSSGERRDASHINCHLIIMFWLLLIQTTDMVTAGGSSCCTRMAHQISRLAVFQHDLDQLILITEPIK